MSEDIFADIKAERINQDKQWGEQNHTNERWLAILLEEYGELATCILNYEGPTYERAELVQIAAVAVANIEAIDRQRKKLKGVADEVSDNRAG